MKLNEKDENIFPFSLKTFLAARIIWKAMKTFINFHLNRRKKFIHKNTCMKWTKNEK